MSDRKSTAASQTAAQEELARTSTEIEKSAGAVEESAVQLTDSADRRTELAADRTLLAAERTYAAWVRTGLTALASGVGARPLLEHILPGWLVGAAGSVLILFSAFCFFAAISREVATHVAPPRPHIHRLPQPVLLIVNGFLILVAMAALIGAWAGPAR